MRRLCGIGGLIGRGRSGGIAAAAAGGVAFIGGEVAAQLYKHIIVNDKAFALLAGNGVKRDAGVKDAGAAAFPLAAFAAAVIAKGGIIAVVGAQRIKAYDVPALEAGGDTGKAVAVIL